MRIEAHDFEEYVAQVPRHRQEALRQLRALVLSVADDVREDMAYGMPTYWAGRQVVCAFASQKNHLSLYLDAELVAAHRPDFGTLNCGKSCIRFARIDQLPWTTVAQILRATYARPRAAAPAAPAAR